MDQHKNMTSNNTPPVKEVGTRNIQRDPLSKLSKNVCFLLLQSSGSKKDVTVYSRDEPRRSDTYEWSIAKTIELTQVNETDEGGSAIQSSQSSPRYVLNIINNSGIYQFKYIGSANVPDYVLRGDLKFDWIIYTLGVDFKNTLNYSNSNAKPLATSIDEVMDEIDRSTVDGTTVLNWNSDAMCQLACSLQMQSEGLGINWDLSEGLLDLISSIQQEGILPPREKENILSILLRVIQSTYLQSEVGMGEMNLPQDRS